MFHSIIQGAIRTLHTYIHKNFINLFTDNESVLELAELTSRKTLLNYLFIHRRIFVLTTDISFGT